MGTTRLVRDQVYDLLRRLKMTTIFGNPGSTEEDFLKHFPTDFRYILGLHEASVVSMADGYAQATGRPALVNLHTHVGTGNAMTGLISAYQNKTPLVVTAGQQTREMLLLEPWLTNVDATMLPRPYVKWSYEPSRAQDVPAAFLRAYATAMQAPTGPVYLSVPMGDWDEPGLTQEPPTRAVCGLPGLAGASAETIAAALNKARAPVLVLGAGIDRSNGWDVAVSLAERLRCPVWAAPASERAVFPENHPQFQGPLPFAIAPLAAKLRGHDLVIVIGAPVFRYYPYVPGDYLPEGARLLHITDDPAEAARAPVGDSFIADPALACMAILPLILESQRPLSAPQPKPALPSKSRPMTPEAFYEALDRARPNNAIIIQESNSNLASLHKFLPITSPASYFATASAGLGWGLPAAVGIALAQRETSPGRPVVAIIGDGAFQYSIQSLWTAARHRLPIIVLVPRNFEYGILKAFATQEDNPGVPGLDLPALDTVALSQGYGCHAVQVDDADALPAAVASALERQGPSVLVVPISPEVPPLL